MILQVMRDYLLINIIPILVFMVMIGVINFIRVSVFVYRQKKMHELRPITKKNKIVGMGSGLYDYANILGRNKCVLIPEFNVDINASSRKNKSVDVGLPISSYYAYKNKVSPEDIMVLSDSENEIITRTMLKYA
jgi:hypothetical protein